MNMKFTLSSICHYVIVINNMLYMSKSPKRCFGLLPFILLGQENILNASL